MSVTEAIRQSVCRRQYLLRVFRVWDLWTAPSFLEAVTSGKVGTHGITEAAPR